MLLTDSIRKYIEYGELKAGTVEKLESSGIKTVGDLKSATFDFIANALEVETIYHTEVWECLN